MEGKEHRRASLKRTFSKHEKAMLGDLSCDNLNDLQRDALNEMKVELAEELGRLRGNQTHNPTREDRLLTYTYLPISVCFARSTRSRAARLLNTRYLTHSHTHTLSLSLSHSPSISSRALPPLTRSSHTLLAHSSSAPTYSHPHSHPHPLTLTLIILIILIILITLTLTHSSRSRRGPVPGGRRGPAHPPLPTRAQV